jgi:hypothetical protein
LSGLQAPAGAFRAAGGELVDEQPARNWIENAKTPRGLPSGSFGDGNRWIP